MCIRDRVLYSSLFAVNGSNDTVQLNNEEKKQQSNAIGTQYTQKSFAYKHFTMTSMVTQCHCSKYIQESLALARMARDDSPASSTASSTAPASSTAAAMRGKVGSEFET